jgi:hypothetical protein
MDLCVVRTLHLPSSLHLADGGSIGIRNVCIVLHHYTASHPRRPRLESSPQWKYQNSHSLPCSQSPPLGSILSIIFHFDTLQVLMGVCSLISCRNIKLWNRNSRGNEMDDVVGLTFMRNISSSSFLGSTAQLRPRPPPQKPAEFPGGFSTIFFFTG